MFKLSVSPEITELLGDAVEPTKSCQSASALTDIYGYSGALAAQRFVETLQAAIRRNDVAALAASFRYPFTIHARRDIVVRTPGAFKQNYRTYLPLQTRQEILDASPVCLFANDQGVMLGSGTVWFEEADDTHAFKAFALNLAQ